jgi:hypothetical protein
MNKLFMKQRLLYIILLIGIIIFPRCTGSVDSRLKKLVEEANTKCPRVLDQWTRLDSCAAFPNQTIRYYHTLSEVTITDTILFKSQLQPQIISSVKTNPDMKFFRENNVAMQYEYRDQTGKYLFSVTINPEAYK